MLDKKKLIVNSLAMVVNKLSQSIATFVISAAIARLLGPYALGQYLLAFSYYFIFVTLSSQALKTLFTRELARNPENTPIYIVNGIFLQLLFSLLAFIFLAAVVFVMPYSDDTSRVCYILGLAVVPFALSNITESIFQAQERMYLIALTTVPVYILRVLAMLVAMHSKYGIEVVAAILVISETVIFLIQFLFSLRFVKPKWKIDRGFLLATVRESIVFFAIEGGGVISGRLVIIILSIFGSELLLGFYGGVVQLLQPFLIVANSMAIAMFPAMSKSVDQGQHETRQITENLNEILMMMALPFLVGIQFVGRDLLIFVYGSSFAHADMALKILALMLIFLPFNRSLSFLLLANRFEKVNLIQVVICTPIAGLVGVFLISHFKLIGAAFTDLFMMVIAASIYIYATYTRLFALNLWRILPRPLLVSLLMAVMFQVLKHFNFDFLAILMISITVYSLLIGTIGTFAFGGPRIVYAKLLNKR